MQATANRRIGPPTRRPTTAWLLATLCLLAFGLRLVPAIQNRFHADEALYGAWAMRIVSERDGLLASVPVDKPPLAIYAMAASLFVFGHSEIAARLPNLIASVVSVALVWRWGQGLRRPPSKRSGRGSAFVACPRSAAEGVRSSSLAPHASSFAALAMALSPFNIAFGGTAFLDPLMVAWGLAACVAAARGRAGWAGILLGLACATKVQGLLFAPLVLMSQMFRTRMNADCAEKIRESAFTPALRRTQCGAYVRVYVRPLISLGSGLATIVLLVFLWDAAREGTPFWLQQTINYGGIRAAFAGEVAPRLGGWLGLLTHFFGPIAGVILLIGVLILLVNALTREARARAAAIDLLLIAYTLGFFALHWLLAFPVWDRYLLILVPVGAMLAGRVATLTVDLLAARGQSAGWLAVQPIVLGVLAFAILPFAAQAARSEVAVGGDHGPHDGIDQVAAYLRGLPVGTVVYDHWLGWEFDFYLWDASLYRAYFETPADLAHNLCVFGQASTRYVVIPAGESPAKIARAIGAAGFALTPVQTPVDRFGRPSFAVYRVTQQTSEVCKASEVSLSRSSMMSRAGLEPATKGLKGPCSAS